MLTQSGEIETLNLLKVKSSFIYVYRKWKSNFLYFIKRHRYWRILYYKIFIVILFRLHKYIIGLILENIYIKI